jgi:general secretion pathway protein D
MGKYLRASSVFSLIVLFASGVLEDVAIRVRVMQVNSERVEHLTAIMASTNTAEDLLQAVLADSYTRVMQTPEVHAADAQKATLEICEKNPDATGGFQPRVGKLGVNPLLSRQFHFADTGLNVELTPHVQGPDEVTLRVSTEVSNVAGMVYVSGPNQLVPARKRNEADIRLRDGEVSVLGKFHGTEDSNRLFAIPGMVNIPALGDAPLGNGQSEKYRQGLVMAMIPHIVRAPAIAR